MAVDLTAALPELLRAGIRRAATLPATARKLRAIRNLVDNLHGPMAYAPAPIQRLQPAVATA